MLKKSRDNDLKLYDECDLVMHFANKSLDNPAVSLIDCLQLSLKIDFATDIIEISIIAKPYLNNAVNQA